RWSGMKVITLTRLESAPAVEETGPVLRREQAHEHSEIVLEIHRRRRAGALSHSRRPRARRCGARYRERPLCAVADGRWRAPARYKNRRDFDLQQFGRGLGLLRRP